MPALGRARHTATQQYRYGRVNRHRVIFLRRRQREEAHHETNQAQREQSSSSCPVDRTVTQFASRRQKRTPWEEPNEMKKPEQITRYYVVIARTAHVQKSKDMFIEEVEPEKAVILPGFTSRRQVNVRGISQSCKHMPWSRNQHGNGSSC